MNFTRIACLIATLCSTTMLLNQSSSAADFMEVYKNDLGTRFFLATDTLKVIGSNPRVWTKMTATQVTDDGWNEAMSFVEFDCFGRRMIDLETHYLRDGVPVSSTGVSSLGWRDVYPPNGYKYILDLICKIK